MQSQQAGPRADKQRQVGGRVAFRRYSILLASLLLIHSAAPQEVKSPRDGIGGFRTIQVASLGDGIGADALRARVINRLQRDGRLKIVEDRSAADVILRGSSSIWATGAMAFNPHSKAAREVSYQGYLSVELLGKADQTLWSYLVTPSRFRTASITDDLADHVVARLLDALATGAAGSSSPIAASPGAGVALHAAGATLPAPLYRKWIESSGMRVTYDAIGSEAGIARLAEGKVDFAASDMPLKPGDSSGNLRVIHFPTVLGGVVPIFNLPSTGRTLRLTPEILSGIYSGAIRKWNDPRIIEINRGARLPDADIAVIYRSDGSGTTFVWTSYLSISSPQWKSSVGAGVRVRWPVGAGASGNEGVAELVAKTPNSIGYVELIYAIQHELSYASVRNAAGEFIKADLASITAAAAGASVSPGEEFRSSILDSRNKGAYPISTFTWLLIPAEGVSPEKRSAMADWLKWALTSGQKQCASLGYAPLPSEIVNSELKSVSKWKMGGQ